MLPRECTMHMTPLSHKFGNVKLHFFSTFPFVLGGYKSGPVVIHFSSRHWHMTEVPLPPTPFAVEANDTHWPVRALWSILPWAHAGLDTTFEPKEHSCQTSPMSFPFETRRFFARRHTHSVTRSAVSHIQFQPTSSSEFKVTYSGVNMEKYEKWKIILHWNSKI